MSPRKNHALLKLFISAKKLLPHLKKTTIFIFSLYVVIIRHVFVDMSVRLFLLVVKRVTTANPSGPFLYPHPLSLIDTCVHCIPEGRGARNPRRAQQEIGKIQSTPERLPASCLLFKLARMQSTVAGICSNILVCQAEWASKGFFQRRAKGFFSRGRPTVEKFHFTDSNTKGKIFFC